MLRFALKDAIRLAKPPRPTCPVHGCEMTPRCLVRNTSSQRRVTRFYCPVEHCRESVKRAPATVTQCLECGEMHFAHMQHRCVPSLFVDTEQPS